MLIKVSLSQAAQEPPSLAAEYFKEIVEERSGGSIRVDVFPDNQLGNERDVIEGIQLGTIEMAMTSVAPFPASSRPSIFSASHFSGRIRSTCMPPWIPRR